MIRTKVCITFSEHWPADLQLPEGLFSRRFGTWTRFWWNQSSSSLRTRFLSWIHLPCWIKIRPVKVIKKGQYCCMSWVKNKTKTLSSTKSEMWYLCRRSDLYHPTESEQHFNSIENGFIKWNNIRNITSVCLDMGWQRTDPVVYFQTE